MSVFIKSFYQKFFPARQLLIRQNGEVKHVVLAPWFQLFTVLLILGTITWVGISSFRVYSQTNKITDIEQSQIDKQQAWQKQVKEQKALHAKQLEQLAVLEQKQALLQGMIESLPASISKETIKLEEQLESPVNQDKGEFHEPLVDEEPRDKHASLLTPITFAARYERLNKYYEHNFALIDAQINKRHDAILAMLKGAGLESALEQHLALGAQTTAQGGPLDVFDETKIPGQFLAIVDKLSLIHI